MTQSTQVEIKRIAFLVAMLLVLFYAVPTLFGDTFYRIMIGMAGGWQIGSWTFNIAERLFPRKD